MYPILFSIGDFYINDFPPSPEKKWRNGKCPLDLIMCKNCNLVQLRHTAPQELMYRRFYWYKSGINETINNDLKEMHHTGGLLDFDDTLMGALESILGI